MYWDVGCCGILVLIGASKMVHKMLVEDSGCTLEHGS